VTYSTDHIRLVYLQITNSKAYKFVKDSKHIFHIVQSTRSIHSPKMMWCTVPRLLLDWVWNVMAHAQKPDFVFRRKGRVHLNWQGRQFSRLLAGELCTSACRVCTAHRSTSVGIARASLCFAVMWRLLATHSLLLFLLHFFTRASPCAITFQTQSTNFDPCVKLRHRCTPCNSRSVNWNVNTSWSLYTIDFKPTYVDSFDKGHLFCLQFEINAFL
jgi:hypothetical protein